MKRFLKYAGATLAVILFALWFSVWTNGAALSQVASLSKERRVLLNAGLREKHRADSLERLLNVSRGK